MNVTPVVNLKASDSNLRKSDIWFDDGNVVTVAEDHLFRVYKGMLTSVSPIFTGLFSLAVAPSNDAELFDGCSMVSLHDLSDDLYPFLKTLFF
ncbi:unnamed protein product [Somion occarium]|uniref:BTB domain-containing protein n=1 Tax=Somion occarium TaxID=3059160 RepID=A0ABP1DVV2_9APHY